MIASASRDGGFPATLGLLTRRLYLDLLKKALMNEVGIENELRIHYLRSCVAEGHAPDEIVLRDIRSRLAEDFEEYLAARQDGNLFRGQVIDCPYTMIGCKRLDNLELLLTRLIEGQVPGDVIECGVWRGGASIFMRGIMKALGALDRTPSKHPAEAAGEGQSFTTSTYGRVCKIPVNSPKMAAGPNRCCIRLRPIGARTHATDCAELAHEYRERVSGLDWSLRVEWADTPHGAQRVDRHPGEK